MITDLLFGIIPFNVSFWSILAGNVATGERILDESEVKDLTWDTLNCKLQYSTSGIV